MGAERCFPFITIGDVDQVICMSEIDLGVNPGLPGSIWEVGSEQNWVLVLLRDVIKAVEIHTKP